MAACNPSQLIADAACFQCLSNKELKAVIAQLLCNINAGGGGSSGDLVFPDEPFGGIVFDGIGSVTSVSIPNATSSSQGLSFGLLAGMANLKSFSAPLMTSAQSSTTGTSITFLSCPSLILMELPVLQTTASGITVEATSLASINFPALTAISGPFYLDGNPLLTTINLPVLAAYISFGAGDGMVASGNPLLTSFNAPNIIFPDMANSVVDFNGDALDQTSVELILSRGVASYSGLFLPITVDLSGGTNFGQAGLSVQGQADLATLTGLGITVIMNP